MNAFSRELLCVWGNGNPWVPRGGLQNSLSGMEEENEKSEKRRAFVWGLGSKSHKVRQNRQKVVGPTTTTFYRSVCLARNSSRSRQAGRVTS